MKRCTVTDRVIQVRHWIDTGQALRFRQDAGVSRAAAAQDCEVTPGAIALWERGKRHPRGRNVLVYHGFLAQLAEQVGAGEGA